MNEYQVNFLIKMYKDKWKWWDVYSLGENFKRAGKIKRRNPPDRAVLGWVGIFWMLTEAISITILYY